MPSLDDLTPEGFRPSSAFVLLACVAFIAVMVYRLETETRMLNSNVTSLVREIRRERRGSELPAIQDADDEDESEEVIETVGAEGVNGDKFEVIEVEEEDSGNSASASA